MPPSKLEAMLIRRIPVIYRRGSLIFLVNMIKNRSRLTARVVLFLMLRLAKSLCHVKKPILFKSHVSVEEMILACLVSLAGISGTEPTKVLPKVLCQTLQTTLLRANQWAVEYLDHFLKLSSGGSVPLVSTKNAAIADSRNIYFPTQKRLRSFDRLLVNWRFVDLHCVWHTKNGFVSTK